MSAHARNTSYRIGIMTVVAAMVAALLTLVTAQAALAAPTVIASDLTSGGPINLISYSPDPSTPFTSAGDGFDKFQRGVSPSIPFAVLDDTLVSFPPDTLGIIDDNNLDPFFGITDTVNSDTTGPVAAIWTFDITGATSLTLSADIGAMGDFEAADTFTFEYRIDGGPIVPLWNLTADEAANQNYTLASGTVVNLDDPLTLGPTNLTNDLKTFTSSLAGSGSTLTVIVTAEADGGTEAVAFQNLIVMGESGGGPTPPSPGDIVITEVMQNPSAVFDSNGEWFELHNTTGADIDLNGWTIRDDDTDSHTIGSSFVVPAGSYAVMGLNDDTGTNGGVTVDYVYSGIALANGADEVALEAPGPILIDHIAYDGGPVFPDPNGASMTLEPTLLDAVSNDNGANWCTATSQYGAGDLGTPGAANDSCVPAYVSVKIHEVQGSGSTVAITGGVEVQGIVTSLFEDNDVLEGFFVQEEDVEADADAATSEGIYVHCDAVCPAGLATGDLVTVQGQAEEFFGMSQIDANDGGSVVIDASGNPLPTATTVNMPAVGSTVAEATFEAIEGMLVTFPDTLVVSEYFQLGRFGQIVLTESSRPYQFTHSNAPSVAGYSAFLDDLAKRRIILDDNNNDNNDFIFDGPDEPAYYPTGGLSTGNKFRGGDTITDMVGVLHWSWAGGSGTDAWRVRPVAGADYSFTSVNPEPGAPADVGGDLKVASFNVLNYFTTIDVTSSNSSGDCGPTGTQDCRGADSEDERLRQRAKILSALSSIDADVVGLVELENDGDDSSIADLVDGLPGYDYIATGFIGSDAIKVGLIYKTGTVSPEGGYAILDSTVDPAFLDTKNRPALIQTFSENATGEKFTVAVNHLKSKGSPCDDVGDPGLNDGQANCPGVRTAAATALANYLATDPTNSGDSDFMILGDLNAYAQEDAIAALEAAGYTNLLAHFGGPTAYSYVFDGQLGYLDYALANESLFASVTGVTEWHINADEVPLFDYNDDIRDAGEASFERETSVGPLYAPDALRSSDHDPVIVGLNLANPMGDKEDVLADLIALTPSGDDHTDKHLNRAIEHLEHSLNPDYWTSDQTIDNKKVFDEERKTVKEIERAVRHGILSESVAEGLMHTLVNADRILARVAIISAADRGVSLDEIDKAEEDMVKAASYWADGEFDNAIDKYKKAWATVNKPKHLKL